ncbi:MAG: biotin/lipoyl-binding protein, partial [Bacteroidales bacterium]|nr:biotin/lipoyl-binding protein [Bacteroidales bacterium]
MKIRTILFSCAVAAVAIYVCSCSGQKQNETVNKENRVVEVSVLQIQPGNNGSSISYVGTVKASKSAKIAAKYSGSLEKINVTKGKYVDKGAVVAEMESQTIKSAYETANATYQYAKDAL